MAETLETSPMRKKVSPELEYETWSASPLKNHDRVSLNADIMPILLDSTQAESQEAYRPVTRTKKRKGRYQRNEKQAFYLTPTVSSKQKNRRVKQASVHKSIQSKLSRPRPQTSISKMRQKTSLSNYLAQRQKHLKREEIRVGVCQIGHQQDNLPVHRSQIALKNLQQQSYLTSIETRPDSSRKPTKLSQYTLKKPRYAAETPAPASISPVRTYNVSDFQRKSN